MSIVIAFLIFLLATVAILFGPSGVTSTAWFVLAEGCALYLTWRWIHAAQE